MKSNDKKFFEKKNISVKQNKGRNLITLYRICIMTMMVLSLLFMCSCNKVKTNINSNHNEKVTSAEKSEKSETTESPKTEKSETENPQTTQEGAIIPDTDIDYDKKVIYLTFDDGPSQYTGQILDVLKKYDVKATFFVTNCSPDYNDNITRESKEGHTVGAHTATHIYGKIYTSVGDYEADFNKINDVIEQRTGKRAELFRFPGGSSNTVSKRYCKGIMTTLAKYMTDKGYTYFDWNVSSGDASESMTEDRAYDNIIDGVQKRDYSVVLMHDTKPFNPKVAERVIKWGIENNYKFMPITKKTPLVKHRIAN